MNMVCRAFFVILYVFVFPSIGYADTETAAAGGMTASRVTADGELLYYSTLQEAFSAAAGTSLDNPDEITLLADVTLDEHIVIESGRHIRLAAGGGARTITRGGVVDYPLFWFRGNDASFMLGKPPEAGEVSGAGLLTIDGGYRNEPSIKARSPLIAITGQRSKMVMYDGVALQNNYNYSDTDGTDLYGHGAGVLIRTDEGGNENMSEFIMKGGKIRGNINNAQNPHPCGGGVYIFAFGLFTMEGGAIFDNTAYGSGGGFHAAVRGSFRKTGGVIYGEDADEGLRNMVINGAGDPVIKGHAVCVAVYDGLLFQFRDDTVGEDDVLSYSGSITGNGVFGEGENWEPSGDYRRRFIIIAVFAVAVVGGAAVFFILRTRRKKQAAIPAERIKRPALLEIARNLPPREKEVFELLLTDRSLKVIADELDISYSGANSHTQKIYRKFGIQSRTELLILFHKNHTISQD
jgi:DNA-binding CsgD family transcriptional regulator